ncbi:MAG: hypothetical protein LBU97_00910 [Alistipes sp.]|jgi:hypothetical protein|nr:hypothetical protein [Alistipes sp.]
MRQKMLSVCVVALMSAFCAGFVACKETPPPKVEPPQEEEPIPPPPPPEIEPEPKPDTYVVEYYRIANQIASDIVVKRHDGWTLAIKPGETREVGKDDYCIPYGVAYARDRVLVKADMEIAGKVVHESIWWSNVYWDCVREDGADEYHYSWIYTLTVTDELLEKVKNGILTD